MKYALVFLLSICPLSIFSQQVPPAQGPGPVVGTTGIRELPVRAFTGFLNILFRDSIMPAVNASIRANDPPVRIRVTHSLKQGKPMMTETKYADRPNQRIITIHYDITYHLDINNFPDRKLYQNLELNFSCEEWYKPGGGLMYISTVSDEPYLGGPTITEQAISFFLGNWLTPFIDGKIRSGLPSMLRKRSPLNVPNRDCNCLNVVSGTAPDYDDGFLQYQNRSRRIPRPGEGAETNFNTITVKMDSIRRLPAKNYTGGGVLYEEVENIALEVWVNQQLQGFDLAGMRDGDARKLPENSITLPKPGTGGTLVLIANVIQSGNFKTDTRFVVFNARQNYGNGIRKMIVRKSFWTRPQRLPGGGTSKPIETFVDAYELTLSINAHIQVVR